MPVKLTLVLARAKNGVIGKDGRLPWRMKSDMERFKAVTMGKPVIMGRRTWAALDVRPLPGRDNIVLTRDTRFLAPGAYVCTDLDHALSAGRAMAQQNGADEICVIGGAEIYRATLPLADRLLLSEVNLDVDGDTRFPLDLAGWREVNREHVPKGEGDDADFTLRTLER